MARVTVEDCLERMSNKFELTTVAAKRARQLARGANAHVAWEDDKSTVMALREIADGHVDKTILDEPELPPVTAGMETPAPPPEEVEENAEPDAAAAAPAARVDDDAAGDAEDGEADRRPEE